jgi:predicted ABC-type ATPase
VLRDCKANGWKISLYYFWLPSPERSIARVARRVREGGHRIPDEVVYRRFKLGLRNMLDLYLPLADEAEIYDNTDRKRVLIAERRGGKPLLVHDSERWARIEEIAR